MARSRKKAESALGEQVLSTWRERLRRHSAGLTSLEAGALEQETATLRKLLQTALDEGAEGSNWDDVVEYVGDLAERRSAAGRSVTETLAFFSHLRSAVLEQGDDQAPELNHLIDRAMLASAAHYQRARDEIIERQQQELLELSTPVVKLWANILILPLIGVLDSGRCQTVMESLLNQIAESGAAIAIIDITGVPTVDTLVAHHLLKTITAARLMGAECIVSGIRPQIAQTIVHLGLELDDIVTKANLADAFLEALQRTGRTVVKQDR